MVITTRLKEGLACSIWPRICRSRQSNKRKLSRHHWRLHDLHSIPPCGDMVSTKLEKFIVEKFWDIFFVKRTNCSRRSGAGTMQQFRLLSPGELSFQSRRSPTSFKHRSIPRFIACTAIPRCFHNARSAGPEALQRSDPYVSNVCGNDRVSCAASRASSFRPSFDANTYARKVLSAFTTGATWLQYIRNRARTVGMPYFLAAANVFVIVSNVSGLTMSMG